MATKSNALADFTRLPTQQKVLLFVVLGMLLGAIYYYVVFKSLDQRLEDARGEHDSKVILNKKLADDIPKFHQLQADSADLQRLINTSVQALPSETELPAFFGTINRRLIESGVELVKTTNQKAQNLEGFVKVPIDFEVMGTFLQLKRFFASLAQKDLGSHDDSGNADDRERIISIENLDLSTPVMRNGSMVLDAKFTAATFHLAEAVGSGSGSGSGAGSGKPAAGSASGPAGAPLPQGAPLPPANTPAGAKARAEAGVEKGAERNANATGVDEAKTPSAVGSGSDRLKGGL